MEMNEQMLQTYLEEADEKIEELNEGLLDYEDEGDSEALQEMFRASHTLKSSSASMGFDDLSELAHRMEDVFDELRDGDLEPGDIDGLFDLLYVCIDTLEAMVDHVREEKEAPEAEVDDLIEKLEKAQEGEDIELEDDQQKGQDEVEEVTEIKVGVERLDTLMNLVGELLVLEKKLRRIGEEQEIEELNSTMDQLKRLGEDIRKEVSGARMIPVNQVFSRFPRTVRDLSKRTGKEVDFQIKGGDLRMDRTIIEELGEPIIHILRNAVDHGIEPQEERKENGKSPEGKITLKAEREGNEAVISVTDDGRGIDTDKVAEKAVERGVINEDKKESISRQEKMELLFDSDMSTNDEVTELSGRGVGLSVVKRTAEKLHGSYDISSQSGEGTRIEMKLPLSLAVVRCFLVRVGDEKYGLPINNVLRSQSVSQTDVKSIESREVFKYDGEEVPIIRMDEKLGTDVEFNDPTLIVSEVGNQRVGLVVNEIVDVQDFVSKDLDLLEIDGMAGAAMLSDGTPVLILDITELIG